MTKVARSHTRPTPARRPRLSKVVQGLSRTRTPVMRSLTSAVARRPSSPRRDHHVSGPRPLQDRLDSEGLVVADAKGNPIPHPALALERQAHAEVRAWGDRFKPRRSARRASG